MIQQEGATKEERENKDRQLIVRGGILGDEMGLGKTLQASSAALIGDLVVMDKAEYVPPTLVLCSKDLLPQWHRELRHDTRLAPEQIVVHYGAKREEWTDAALKAKNVRFVLTSYGLVRQSYVQLVRISNHGKPGPMLHSVAWGRILLDEAQAIRNRKSVLHEAVLLLKSRQRWCLTGTPISNESKNDLGALAAFVGVSPYNGVRWWKTARPDEIVQWRDRFLLRRTLSEAQIDLPPLTIEDVHLSLLEREQVFYTRLEEETVLMFDEWLSSRMLDVDEGESGGESETALLVWLNRLRQAACHPLLATGGREATSALLGKTHVEKSSKCVQCRKSNLECKRLACGHVVCLGCSSQEAGCRVCRMVEQYKQKPDSSRISHLARHVQMERPAKSKSIVFSQWCGMLDLVEHQLQKHAKLFRIDGGVGNRDDVLQAFRECKEKAVLLMSYKIGSQGHNLTCADCVYLLDPWYNPTTEDQAIKRAHRIGQTRPVQVHRFASRTRVEQAILQMNKEKRQSAKDMLESDAPAVYLKKPSMSEVVQLFVRIKKANANAF